MFKDKVRLLLVQIEKREHSVFKNILKGIENCDYILDWESDPNQALHKIQQERHDAYIIGYDLGSITGLDILKSLGKKSFELPIILLTRDHERNLDIQAMKAGAEDFLVIDEITPNLLEKSIRYAIQNKSSQRQKEEQIKQETINRYLSFISEASKVLSSSLDYPKVLTSLANLTVPGFADWCGVFINTPDNQIKDITIAHQDISKVQLVREFIKRNPVEADAPYGIGYIIRSGKTVLSNDIAGDIKKGKMRNPKLRALIKRLSLKSYMVVPIECRGNFLGAMVLLTSESNRKFSSEDLYVAQELASHAALAIDNAKLFETTKQNEEQLRCLTESIPQLVWINDLNGKPEYYNPQMYGYTGLTDQEIYGENFFNIVHPDDIEKSYKKWKKSLETGQLFEIEQRLKNGTTGEYRWFLGRALPLKNRKGKIIKWFGTYTDIHQQKLNEVELLRNQIIFRTLYDANIVGVMLVDLEGTVREANEAFLNTIGYTREDLRKGVISWKKITPEAYKELDIQKAEEIVKTGVATPYEKEYTRKDGSRVPVIVGGALLDRSTTETIAFILDISERKKLEQRKDEFLSIASHELKTPLTSVKGYLQILEKIVKGTEDEKIRNYVSKTHTYVDRLSSLINDLLDISKIQSGILQIDNSEFDFAYLIKDSIDAVQPTTPRHCIIVEKYVHQKVVGDRNRLEQVLTNILSNAVKYSPQADKVIVESFLENGQLVTIVRDFGIGIPRNKQKQIFDRFYRVEKDARHFSGLGIGLYISQEIINRHGGKIWVESQEGKGSKFILTLPTNQSLARRKKYEKQDSINL